MLRSLFLCAMVSPSLATDLGVNLLENPDAETGDMTGWTPMDQIELRETAAVGDLGVPPGVSIGEWCFTGRLGAEKESCSQAHDVSDLADLIDAGGLPCTVRALLQSRAIPGAMDVVTLFIQFEDAGGGVLATHALVDPVIDVNVFDWNDVELLATLPVSTRSIIVTIHTEREVGASTDAYADNLELILGDECAADVNGDGVLNILDFVAFQSLFVNADPAADCDANGLFNILDFVCFQALFTAGCP